MLLNLLLNPVRSTGSVVAGRVLVDGLGIGDVGNIVLRDRKHLSQDGLMVVVITMSRNDFNIIAGP
jgi:ribonuclease J